MLSSHKKLWLKSALAVGIISPIILATVVSCANTPEKQPGEGSGEGSGSGSGSTDSQLPTFLQKELDQAQNLVINNKTWSKITNFNVERQVQTEEYETYARRRYKDTFKYPAWDWNWKNPQQGNNGWHEEVIDWEYPGQEGTPVVYKALDGAKILREERTDFEIGKDNQGNPVFAKYNDARFILNEIKNGTLKKHYTRT